MLGLVVFFYTMNCFFDSLKKARKEHDSPWPNSLLEVGFMSLGVMIVVLGLADVRLQGFVQSIVLIFSTIPLLAFGILLVTEMLPVMHKRAEILKNKVLIRREMRQYRKMREYEDYIAHTQASTINRQVSEDQTQSEEIHLGNEKERARAFAIPLIDAELKYYRLQLEYEGQSGLSKQIYERELAEQKKHIDENQNAFQLLDRETQKWALDQFNLGKAEIDKAYPVVFKRDKVADEPPIEDSGVPPLVKPSKMGTRKTKAATQPTSTCGDRLITKRNPAGAGIPNPTSAREPRAKSR